MMMRTRLALAERFSFLFFFLLRAASAVQCSMQLSVMASSANGHADIVRPRRRRRLLSDVRSDPRVAHGVVRPSLGKFRSKK
jgi:hypothetical protein